MKQKLYQKAINLYLEAQAIADKHPSTLQYLNISADLCYCYNQVDDKAQFHIYLEKFYWAWYENP
jgi:hypothetical protein